MELEELIVEIVIGLFLLFISYQIGIKENITLLHGYHYTQLDPKDKKVFTKKIGIGTGLWQLHQLKSSSIPHKL